MPDLALDTYFRDHPLAPDELSAGRALRLAGCLRSGEGRFSDGPVSHLWVLLSCARAPRRPIPPVCATFAEEHGLSGVRRVAARRLARHELELSDGRRWVVDEHAICVPDELPRFLAVAGTRRVAAGRQTHRDLLPVYDELIANASVDPRYPEWLARRREALLGLPAPEPGLLMSLVTPAYRTPPELLRAMLASVLAQTYPRWELVLVNASPGDEAMGAVLAEFADPRVRVVEAPGNLGIAGNTNLGISCARGDYVSFLDHDDELEPCALAEMVRAIERSGGEAGLLYCDEDNIDEAGTPFLPLLKPSFNPDLLLSNDYVLHLLTVRRDLLEATERSGRAVEGAQDYDLTLKVAERGAVAVRVPEVLYHWRVCAGSSAADPASKEYAQEAGVRAIESHLGRVGTPAEVRRGWAYFTYEVRFPVPDPAPSIAVSCDGRPSPATRAALDAYAARREARAAEQGEADLVLHVTPDHDLDLESLELLVGYVAREGTFSAAPRVVRDDGLLDYAGMVVRPDGTLGRLLRCLPQDDGGYVGRAQRPYDALVVNPECCLVDARALARLGLAGGFLTPGYALAEAFVRAYGAGLRNVFLPYATARLCAPRAVMTSVGASERADAARMVGLFPRLAEGDPSHSPRLDPWSDYYRLAWS